MCFCVSRFVASVFIAINPTYLLCQMYANPPKLNSKGPYSSPESEIKFRRCLFTFSIKHEIRHFRVVTARKCTKKRDAHAKLLFCLLNVLFFRRSRCRRVVES